MRLKNRYLSLGFSTLHRPRRRALTLLELLVSLALAGVLAAVLMGGLYALLKLWQNLAQDSVQESQVLNFKRLVEADWAAAVPMNEQEAFIFYQAEPFYWEWDYRLSPYELRRVIYRLGPPPDHLPLSTTAHSELFLYRTLLHLEDELSHELSSEDLILGPLHSIEVNPIFLDEDTLSLREWQWGERGLHFQNTLWPNKPASFAVDIVFLREDLSSSPVRILLGVPYNKQ